jgi:hypothetical protein
MGKSFVYNTGTSKDDVPKKHLELSFGVFIDGTLNNKKNTELRRKYRYKDVELTEEQKKMQNGGLENLTDEQIKESVEKDEAAYDALDNKEITNKTSEKDQYLIASHRSWLDKKGTDNSFSNDYTNVARMWKCCDEVKYAIYVEGMGTKDNLMDSQDGFAFGSGTTGIRAKVRKGCKDLAIKILNSKKDNDSKTVTQITVDVFGFSRGAASARNFAHEVNVKKAYAPKQTEIPDGFYPVNPYSTRDEAPRQKYRTALADDDGVEIDSGGLVNGMLPRMGYLGYCLLKDGVVSAEELEDIRIVVRFLGVYDTVSSYYERNDRLGIYDYKGELIDDDQIPKLAVQKFSSQFLENVKPLNLNNFGYVQKIVHFTAKDEHRLNFDLTRVAGANLVTRIIEKNFPGVHCDIGGAYENETEIKDKLEVARFHHGRLKELMEQLIKEYWFKEDQIDIDGKFLNFITFGTIGRVINTSRPVQKEYSYIPLHFMEEFCRQTSMKDFLIRKTESDYPIDSNDFLTSVRTHLRGYVFNDGKEWEFKDDQQLEIEKAPKEGQKERQEKELATPLYDLNQEGDYSKSKPLSDYIPASKEAPPVDSKTINLEEVVVKGIDAQKALRKLRNEYLHWSSHRKWFGMEPNANRKRVEH